MKRITIILTFLLIGSWSGSVWTRMLSPSELFWHWWKQDTQTITRIQDHPDPAGSSKSSGLSSLNGAGDLGGETGDGDNGTRDRDIQ